MYCTCMHMWMHHNIVASAMYLYILESYHPTLKIWCSYTLFDIMFYQQCPRGVK